MKTMRITIKKPFFIFLLIFFISCEQSNSTPSDTISQGQSLTGSQTIVSEGGVFELGFFKSGNSLNNYIGIWYNTIPTKTVVWVANRNMPISNLSSATLKLAQEGNLVLLGERNAKIWSTDVTVLNINGLVLVAKLLDSGNFVIVDSSDNRTVLWQSFDHPTDHWLPGGKLGYNKLNKWKQNLVPWKSPDDPSAALFSAELKHNSTSHLLVWNDSHVYWTSGEWDGQSFEFVPEIRLNYLVTMSYVSNENESYFTYKVNVPFTLSRFLVNSTGQLNQYVWRKDLGAWAGFWTRPEQQCEVFAFCGGFSSCNQSKLHPCDCVQGFKPKVLKKWDLGDHSDGCVRKTALNCTNNNGTDKFFWVPNTKFPVNPKHLSVSNAKDCELECLKNCTCTAYAYDDKGCLIWGEEFLNMKQLLEDDKTGKDLHVRVAASEIKGITVKEKKNSTPILWIVVGSMGGFFLFFGFMFIFVVIRKRRLENGFETGRDDNNLLVFKYQDLRNATNNFSEKLGKGAFGSVYKGTLPDSNVAVKELNGLPKSGEKQFRAEVSTIGTIQHINLVHLRGFCAEKSKRLLVYEYMPNGSLESHLFRKQSKTLTWKARYNIAIGTARGLSYLHEKCRDCIIHCDIKPENILLDSDLNPKVADFGLAKLLGREFSRVLTTVRGTRGYLAPEWISGEPITPNADVFSYGMLLFEIISGRRNRALLEDGSDDYFPSRVANAINNGENLLDLIDENLEENADLDEVSKACNVACWCIQDDEKDRPSMGKVVQILEGVSKIGKPPIPRFIRRLLQNPSETINYLQDPSILY